MSKDNIGSLPDVIRVPLHKLWADAGYLVGRARDGDVDLAVHRIKALCDEVERATLAALSASQAEQGQAPAFQQRMREWVVACFGEKIADDRAERNHRFLEESLELVQSLGCSASEAHQLVDYTFGRPAGEPRQEVGGVVTTLSALCSANGFDMNEAAEAELARIWTKVEQIRAKQAAKPKHSPLPAAFAAAPQAPRLCMNCTADGKCMKRQALCAFTGAAEPQAPQPRLTVRLQSFPESNGKRNWTAMLVRVDPWSGLIGNCGGITIDRGECWNRVAYEAERAKLLIGERDTEPDILDYGDDITTPDQWAGEVRGGRPVRDRKASPKPPAEQPVEPLLFRDLALELGVSVATLTQTVARRGLGNFSVNMAVPVAVAKAARDPAFGLMRDAATPVPAAQQESQEPAKPLTEAQAIAL